MPALDVWKQLQPGCVVDDGGQRVQLHGVVHSEVHRQSAINVCRALQHRGLHCEGDVVATAAAGL